MTNIKLTYNYTKAVKCCSVAIVLAKFVVVSDNIRARHFKIIKMYMELFYRLVIDAGLITIFDAGGRIYR